MRLAQLLSRLRPPGSMRSIRWSLARKWPMRIKGVDLPETPGRPSNSPFFEGRDGNVRFRVAQNTETGVYTAHVRIVGCRATVAEGLDEAAALTAALTQYSTVPNAGPRTRDITAQDRAEVAAILGRAEAATGVR
jgi:hypothetical protein